MDISPLQKARYEYQPKLPGMLRNGISEISVQEGAATQSVADQDKIKALFPNTYGKNEITFVKGSNTSQAKKQVVGQQPEPSSSIRISSRRCSARRRFSLMIFVSSGL